MLNGTATSVHSTDTASTTISTVNNADYAIRQTFQRYNYQSGKSQFILMTFANFENEEDITKKVGYYSTTTSAPYVSNNDGIHLESSPSGYSIEVNRSGTNVHSIDRADWDDPMDGNGASGVTIDFSMTQIFAFDFEWLGTGRIRFYWVIDGMYVQFHAINNANNEADVYMSSPNQPLRWEIRQSGASGGSFKVICASVNSEGAINLIGKVLSSNAGSNDLQFNGSGTTYAGIGIRLKSTHLDGVVKIIKFGYLSETNDRALWELRLNPTVTGTFAYSPVTNSAVETSIGNQTGGAAPTVSGGTILSSGYIPQQSAIDLDLDSAIGIGVDIDGVRDEIVLCITPINAGLDAFVEFTWIEFV